MDADEGRNISAEGDARCAVATEDVMVVMTVVVVAMDDVDIDGGSGLTVRDDVVVVVALLAAVTDACDVTGATFPPFLCLPFGRFLLANSWSW